MKKFIAKSLLLSSLTFLSFYSSAQEASLSYDFLEIEVAKLEVIGEDFTGFGIAGSYSLSDSIFMSASIANGESDEKYFGDTIDLKGFTFGLGYHAPLGESTDFVSSLSYVSTEADFANVDDDADGYAVDLGVRSLLAQNFDLGAYVSYSDTDGGDGEFSLKLDAKVMFSEAVSIVAGYENGDDFSGLSAALRWDF